MKFSIAYIALLAGLIGSTAVFAQAPATAPTGSTGLCNDGSYTSTATKQGACRGHKGVKDWYGPDAKAAAATAASAKVAPAAAATGASANVAPAAAAAAISAKVAPATAAAPSTNAVSAVTSTAVSASGTAAIAGGGPGQVWVNTGAKVYHCPGTEFYGKTKQGAYMTEAAAKAAGNRAARGKSCSS